MCSILQAAEAPAPEQLRKVTDNFETTKFFGEFFNKILLPCGEPAAGLLCSNPPAGPSGPVGFLKRVQRYALSKSPPNFSTTFFKKIRRARISSENPPENLYPKTGNKTIEPQSLPAMTQDKNRAEARSADKFAGADGNFRT